MARLVESRCGAGRHDAVVRELLGIQRALLRRAVRRDWYLSPEQSLLLHAEHTVIPQQVVVYTPKGTNNTVTLLFGTSLYDLRQKQMPPAADITVHDGLRLFTPEAALVRVPESFFSRYPVEAQVALSRVRDASDLLGRLLDGGHSVVAGRLAGALRRMEKPDMADEIVGTMKGAGYDVRENDPFAPEQAFGAVRGATSPIVSRLNLLWEAFREPVLAIFPNAPASRGTGKLICALSMISTRAMPITRSRLKAIA